MMCVIRGASQSPTLGGMITDPLVDSLLFVSVVVVVARLYVTDVNARTRLLSTRARIHTLRYSGLQLACCCGSCSLKNELDIGSSLA